MAKCNGCEGTKYVLNSYDCERCKGTGELMVYVRLGVLKVQPCPDCDHGRTYAEELCTACNGTGII